VIDFLGDRLFDVSSALLVPVVVSLFVLLAGVLFGLGRFLREWVDRRRGAAAERAIREGLFANSMSLAAARESLRPAAAGKGLVARFARSATAIAIDAVHLDAIVADCEIEGSRVVSKTSWIARAAPVLGLMGTLIPMGPALMQLADGDMAALSRSLVVAFATTVVGLVAGLIAATMATVRRHWYASDLAWIEHAAACLAGASR
jgi:biopolymer transport protein ExbB/TolQ